MDFCRFIGRPWMRTWQMYPWRPLDSQEKRARWGAVWYGEHPKNHYPWKWLRQGQSDE